MTTIGNAKDDLDLVVRARDGDRAAQERIYRDYADRVFTLAMRMLGQRQAAEEVLQDTFIKVLTRLASFRGDARLATWIHRIAVNECLMIIRSPWRQRAEVLRDPGLVSDSPDHAIDLERALMTLPLRTRAVVWLHDVEGYTHREIARMMGQTPSYSKSRLARAHQAMRRTFSQADGEPACMPLLNNS